jgi:hypothetical protein
MKPDVNWRRVFFTSGLLFLALMTALFFLWN